MSGTVTPYRFTVDEYYRMAEAGIFTEDDRVELIDGEIIKMSPIGSPHAGCVSTLDNLVRECLGARVHVRVQNPVRLSLHSEPEPDLAVVVPRADNYRTRHPTPEDVLLIIEVSDTTLPYDRDVKLPLYAAAGIPEVWIADIGGEAVSASWEPRGGQYQRTATYRRGDTITSVTVPELTLAVDEILG